MTTPNFAHEHAAGGTALLIVDMIGSWDFPDAAPLLRGARAAAQRIASLKARCRRAGVPVIYANDNHGRWRSDFRCVTDASLEGPGADITQLLLPDDNDYFVLKPKHSAFFATPLTLLLKHLHVERLIVTGVAGDQCVLNTAVDAHMNGLDVVLPRDCIASGSADRDARLLQHLSDVMKLPTTPAARVRLPSTKPRRQR
jgi:nicotinamidase-related amidase